MRVTFDDSTQGMRRRVLKAARGRAALKSAAHKMHHRHPATAKTFGCCCAALGHPRFRLPFFGWLRICDCRREAETLRLLCAANSSSNLNL